MKTYSFKILTICIFTLFLSFVISCGKSNHQNSDAVSKSINADTCEGPDADINCSFININRDLTNTMVIADQNEPGERMIITGKVVKADGTTPIPGAIIYAYHTDNKGYYSKKGNETGVQKYHGYLHGWCKTDLNGYYEIQSIRPARYPVNKFAAHIHAAVKPSDNEDPIWINDFVFKDDSFVDSSYIKNLREDGGTGVVELKESPDGILKGERIIVLQLSR